MLFVNSKRARRVSWSTFHSEANPAVSCAAVANIIASRITELEYYNVHGRHCTIRDLLHVHGASENLAPADMCTDAMNLFGLVCHSESLPNGKHHRVRVLALREDRVTRRLRHVIHTPTKSMLAV